MPMLWSPLPKPRVLPFQPMSSRKLSQRFRKRSWKAWLVVCGQLLQPALIAPNNIRHPSSLYYTLIPPSPCCHRGFLFPQPTHRKSQTASDTWHHQDPLPPHLSHFSHRINPQVNQRTAKPASETHGAGHEQSAVGVSQKWFGSIHRLQKLNPHQLRWQWLLEQQQDVNFPGSHRLGRATEEGLCHPSCI